MATIKVCDVCGEQKAINTTQDASMFQTVETVGLLARCFPQVLSVDRQQNPFDEICMPCWSKLTVLIEVWKNAGT